MTRRLYMLLLPLLIAVSLHATDRYISPTGDDTKLCIQSAPCKTIARALHVRQSGEPIHLLAGTYGLPNVESVLLIADGAVQVTLPTGNVPLSTFAVWSPPPSTADVQIGLKAGGRINRAQWFYRSNPLGLAYCYVDKGTAVEVVK